jgi:4-hydroxybenzoate polyprenyltransferase
MSAAAGDATVTAWRQLLRAANVFTAASNVIAGFLIVRGGWSPEGVLALLVASSASLYLAGMVLNDVFDAELDAVERPERPIPSGRIARSTAATVGWALLAAGLAGSWAAAWLHGYAMPGLIGTLLALAIVEYDRALKATWVGPVAMGWCRVLNVLLGASASSSLATEYAAMGYALGIGLYTAALTLAARSEALGDESRRRRTRQLVTRMIQGFIVIDAIAAGVAAGWASGLVVLALLAPTLAVARRTPMT